MQITCKNRRLERVVFGVNVAAAVLVTASFAVLFGFKEPLVAAHFLYVAQYALLGIFIAEKVVRFFNCFSCREFWRANWYEVGLFVGLVIAVLGAGRWFGEEDPAAVRHFAVGIYLVVQVVIKVCRTTVNMAASGRNPTRTLIASFLVLILTGTGVLMLPRSASEGRIGFVDALFTATSATCVTGLIVKDTGTDFSLMGQVVILALIQLGGLGIVVFGAVFALLLGQALSVREQVVMQDLLSARTLGRIGNMITFIFFGTLLIEGIGVLGLHGMWKDAPGGMVNIEPWFCSIFHSISAFCNAGFSLFKGSFIEYNRSWPVYGVVCPLIILGGLGFGVLYDLANTGAERVKRFFKKLFSKHYRFSMEAPKRVSLQSKIVLAVSAFMIVAGMFLIMLFERYTVGGDLSHNPGIRGAFFQSVTARTAGFNTVDISGLSGSSKLVLILLMFIGGSPGSAAGGIKTVTLAVVIMTAVAALRKRWEVEMFKRSVRVTVVGRAITVTLLFIAVLFTATLALAITEDSSGFGLMDIGFEAASALGTVGLTTGITGSLTAAGKLIIIVVMLVGRLGPLTLLAALTFNLKPARYNYPAEAIIVG